MAETFSRLDLSSVSLWDGVGSSAYPICQPKAFAISLRGEGSSMEYVGGVTMRQKVSHHGGSGFKRHDSEFARDALFPSSRWERV
jgi:hypothetical protein